MNKPNQAESFATTHWSMVLAAGHKSAPQSEQALAELCQAYWGPVYTFVRRKIAAVHDAQDLTQAFFTRLLERNLLAVAEPERGRFRSFLLASVQHFLCNESDRQQAQKRGGGQKLVALDFQRHDSRHRFEPADLADPERIFMRAWALTLLEQVMSKLRAEHVQAGKELIFEKLKGSLSRGAADISGAEIAAELGMSPNAVKVAAHRLRRRYRELLRAEIAQTLADPADIDDEIRELFAALRGSK